MHLHCMGLRTDLAMLDAEQLDRGDYLVVRSPREPQFYWGNLLVFPVPPESGDLQRWSALFEAEFGDEPRIRHRCFAWDSSAASAACTEFVDSGFRHERTVVLSASSVAPPPRPNTAIEVRELCNDDDWQAALRCQIACRDDAMSEEQYAPFVQARMAALRRRAESGEGSWFGAYLQGAQVANLGIFHIGELARFQMVCTAPEVRRQGICGTLVHEVARRTLREVGTLVMLADEDYHAARIYESLGFARHELLQGLCRWPTQDG